MLHRWVSIRNRGDAYAVICRKATVALPDANFLSSRAQNRHFCVRNGDISLVLAPSEHKIGVFVRFLPSKPPFSGISSTKSAFLCQKRRYFPGFSPFRAQNRGFCALFAFETPIFGHFEHKIGIFVSETAIFPWFCPLPSTKSAFLCAFAGNQTIGNGNQAVGNG